MGPLVGYSINTPGYRVWDPSRHKVWDVRSPDFDELVSGAWWKQPVAASNPRWEMDVPLHLMGGLDLGEDAPAGDDPQPPADEIAVGGGGGDDDDSDGDGRYGLQHF